MCRGANRKFVLNKLVDSLPGVSNPIQTGFVTIWLISCGSKWKDDSLSVYVYLCYLSAIRLTGEVEIV